MISKFHTLAFILNNILANFTVEMYVGDITKKLQSWNIIVFSAAQTGEAKIKQEK